MKRFLSILLTLTMIVGLTSLTAFAADPYKITIDNAVKDEVYTAYKIFDETQGSPLADEYVEVPLDDITKEANRFVTYYTKSGDNYTPISDPTTVAAGTKVYEKVNTPVTYTINITTTTPSLYGFVTEYATATPSKGLILSDDPTDTTKKRVSITEGTFSAADFAQFLKGKIDALSPEQKTALGNAGVLTGTGTSDNDYINVAAAGYYFIDTSLGALCALNTTTPTVTVKEKNTIPSEDKVVYDTTNPAWAKKDDAQIGDTVYFKITVTDGIGTDSDITVYDDYSDGLTLNESSVKVYEKVKAPVDAGIGTYYELTDKEPKLATAVDTSKTYYTAVNSGNTTWSL